MRGVIIGVVLAAVAAAGAAPLEAGRYVAVVDGGEVGLVLGADGAGTFGGAAVRWQLVGDVLTLRPAAGAPYELRVVEEGGRVVLVGPPHGRIVLRADPEAASPAPTAEGAGAGADSPAPPVPLAWVGGWLHRASGGALVLRLAASGVMEMEQQGAVGAERTTGRWVGDAATGALTLTPDGGAPLTYTARRDGEALVVSGGDLPTAVRFVPDTPR